MLIVWQSVAVEGHETGEHAPGLKLRGTGAYRAAHHIIKVTHQFLDIILYHGISEWSFCTILFVLVY